MKNEKISLVYFGNEQISSGNVSGTPIIKSLITAGYFIEAIVVNNEQPTSRTVKVLEMESLATEHKIPIHSPKTNNDLVKLCESFKSSCAILVSYGKIIPEQVLELFDIGIVNVHPSLLPKHRGPIPIESVILNGELETGISIMKLAKEMDSGPIYGQSTLRLDGKETKQELTKKLQSLAANLLIELLPSILDGTIQTTLQSSNEATYDTRISKLDGNIEWSLPAISIERQIRAYSGWPNSRTTISGINCIITKATILVGELPAQAGELFMHNKQLAVHCGNDALILDSIKPAGKNEMSSQAFLAGYKNRLKLVDLD